jgi:hypothetical protein
MAALMTIQEAKELAAARLVNGKHSGCGAYFDKLAKGAICNSTPDHAMTDSVSALFMRMDDDFPELMPKIGPWTSPNSKMAVASFLGDFLKLEAVKSRLSAEGELGPEGYAALLERTVQWYRVSNRMRSTKRGPPDAPAEKEVASPPLALVPIAESSPGASAAAAPPPSTQDEAGDGDGPEIEVTQITEEEEEEEEEEANSMLAASKAELRRLTSTLEHALWFLAPIKNNLWAQQLQLECQEGLGILHSMHAEYQ